MVAAVHKLPEEPPTNQLGVNKESTSVVGQGRATSGGSVGGDLWPAVCGGDQGGSHGHEQDRSGETVVRGQLSARRSEKETSRNHNVSHKTIITINRSLK